MKNSFFLSTISQKRTSPDFKRFEKSEVQKIAGQMANNPYLLAAKILKDYIVLLNTLKMEQKARSYVMDALRKPLIELSRKIILDFTKEGFPKSSEEKESFQLYVSIEKEFATSYWLMLKEHMSSGAKWKLNTKKQNAFITHRILRSMSNIIKAHYAAHETIPNFFWLDLHSFYNSALEESCGDIKINDVFPDITVNTVTDLYKECVLYKLIDADNLIPWEVYQSEKTIEVLATHVKIRKERIRTQRQQCIILIHEDEAPFWQTSESKKIDTSERYVDLTDLYLFFKNNNEFVQDGDSRFKFAIDANKDRNKISGDLMLHIEQKLSCTENKVPSIFSDRAGRMFSIGIDSAYICKSGSADSLGLPIEYMAESGSRTSLSCKIDKAGLLSIGSLVSFRKNENDANRAIGIINKITQNIKDKINFEINTLTTKFDVGRLETIGFDSQDADSHFIIMYFSTNNKGKRIEYILCRNYLLSESNTFSLYKSNSEFIVTLKNPKCIGRDTWRYEVGVLKPVNDVDELI